MTGIVLCIRVTFLDPIFISALGRPVVARAANGGMSEDEALAAALAASLGGSSESGSQSQASNQLSAAEQEDMQLAMALAESERLAAGAQTATAGGDKDKSCRLQWLMKNKLFVWRFLTELFLVWIFNKSQSWENIFFILIMIEKFNFCSRVQEK